MSGGAPISLMTQVNTGALRPHVCPPGVWHHAMEIFDDHADGCEICADPGDAGYMATGVTREQLMRPVGPLDAGADYFVETGSLLHVRKVA